jgi:sugar phosphate isomerase/epimerase
MIEIACQTYSLRGLPAPAMFESVRKAGFRAVELWAGHADWSRGPGSAAAVRRAAERVGIRLQAYCVGGQLRQPAATVEARLERAFAYAADLGVGLVTGLVDAAAVGAVDAVCRRTGMRFALENHWYADFARSADFAMLAPLSPLVGVTLDTGHLAAAGEEPLAARAALGPRLMNVHVKDVVVPSRFRRLVWRRPRMEGRSLGTGEVPLQPFLAALAADGYAGCLAVEDERADLPLAELNAALRACTVWMRSANGTNHLAALS